MAEGRFTVVDLLCIVLVVIVGAILLVPVLTRVPRDGHVGACQANLSALGKNLPIYAGSNKDADNFPVLMSDGDPNAPCGSTTISDNLWEPRLGSNAMQNVWVLIASALGGPELFTCPNDPTAGTVRRPSNTGGATGKKYGWTHDSQFSYGMHFPYARDAKGNINPANPKDQNLNGALVIMADRNPGGPVGPGRPQSNHPDGTYVLHKGGWVSRYANPNDSKAGDKNDDIYVNGNGVAGGLPVDTATGSSTGSHFQTDTSICPVPSR